ncbi:hypothetical protein DFP72DRAFT_1058265 [Ephemerocybe angulata]|uniref:Transmembrane protein n=1 Tax=Ephemerocybe angulata TaxID=980116 RepID=A0A8H6IJN8_9AGAR|nr:hypothetical protein DFP72DRAFT_1058265 [Tulosesus angulatus]
MLGVFASAVASTVVIATQEATVYGPGVTEDVRKQLIQAFACPPLRYRPWPHVRKQLIQAFACPLLRYRPWPQNIAWAVLVWLAFALTAASTILLLRASAYDKRHGPEERVEGVAVESEREPITKVGSEKRAVGV